MNRILKEQGGRVLAFGAHPDDIEVGAGGLLARLALQADVTIAVVSIPNEVEQRRAEALEKLLERLEVKTPERRHDDKPGGAGN